MIIKQLNPITDLSEVISINLTHLPEHYTSSFYSSVYNNFPEAFLLAEVDGKIVGYIMCRIEQDRGHILSIAIVPEYRRKLIGSSLTEIAMKAMKNRRLKECFLEVRVSNTAAISTYKSLGFNIINAVPSYYLDGEAAYTMSREI